MKELIVFSASWCAPCQNLKNMLIDGEVVFTEVDIDTYPEEAMRWGVRSIPTVQISIAGERSVVKTRVLKEIKALLVEEE